MGKNLLPKIILIVVLVAVAAWTLYPPSKTLKPGIDLAGGTSLIYEIDAEGLKGEETKDLAQRMITVLRRRIDPANIQNLVWRPQGNTRFEIQMPLASAETRTKRQQFEQARTELLEKNINPATIIHSLERPPEERAKDFQQFAQKDPNQLKVLQSLATAYDQRKELQNKREQLDPNLKATEEKLSSAALDLARIKQNVNDWAKLNDPNLQKSLKEFLGSESNLELLTGYVKTYAQWAEVVNQLPDKYAEFEQAKRELDKLSLTPEQLDSVLEMPAKSAERKQRLEKLKAEFSDRAEKINQVVAAFDQYRPYRGRLDDPDDLRRMLKGAGILEFRILPTTDRTELTPDEINSFIELLKTKGPKYASDDRYVWCEIESADNWRMPNSIVAPFGDKHYVLASNRKDETMLRGPEQGQWKLEKAAPSTDSMGRRAIGFKLNDRGGRLFANVTGKNIGRPLCILLDKIAISAPGIESRIRTEGIITGNFTQTEITDMVNKLNAGSLPARLIEQPISIKSIGPSIGADNRNQGIRAGFIGLMIVIACIAIYYTLAGSIADVALLMNLLFTLAIMAALGATFTLPGIAGAILTIGMSVDANVLIFERIREEQQKGTALRMAIKNGYEKAFSAIFDSNLTTVISAAVLYWVGSEDIKGFAIVLMLGLISNLFTAVFATRVIFEWLLAKQLIKERLIMLQLIRRPNINWMRLRPIFFTISAVLTIGGVAIFFTRNDVKNNKYDIEFTGGTIVQINLKEGVSLSRQEVENKVGQVGLNIGNSALAAASVYSVGKTGRSYEITTTATNKTTAAITFTESGQTGQQTVQSVTAAITKAEANFPRRLSNLVVTQTTQSSPSFVVSTSQISPSLVKNVLAAAFPNAQISEPQVDEVVNNAVKTAFEGELEIQRNLEPEITSKEKITNELADAEPELVDFLGGIKIQCRIAKAGTAQELDQRVGDLRFKPDMQSLDWSVRYKIFGPDMKTMEPNQPMSSFVYASAQPEAGLRELTEDEWTRFVENETAKVLAATTLETSLPRVTQISPSVGAEARTRALVAIVLTLIAMLAYIWFRFGDLRFGIGAVVTLFHDTCVNVGMVTACTYIAGTFIGQKLLIGDFKINLAMIAAFLTLLGYSINDTIVIYDRIRENRRKGTLTPQIINDSINDTLSRTLLTGTTTIIVVFIMYVFGGQGLRGFNFAMLFGIIEGTYSSIAISAPILLISAKVRYDKSK
jgi:SecD/SecF fusion protein